MINLKKKKIPSDAEKERGKEILFSLKILMNVLFTLLIFQSFLILPRPDDPDLEYYTLSQIFSENIPKLLVILVGLILIGTYWIQMNRQLGNLVRSSGLHASVGLAQMICLMLYLYFVRFDLEFDGLTIALQMQSVFLALAGFLGLLNWVYARKNKLTSDQINDFEERSMFYQMLPEPVAALFSLPFASMGSEAWSISFLIILPLTFVCNKIAKSKNVNPK